MGDGVALLDDEGAPVLSYLRQCQPPGRAHARAYAKDPRYTACRWLVAPYAVLELGPLWSYACTIRLQFLVHNIFHIIVYCVYAASAPCRCIIYIYSIYLSISK